MKTPRDAAPDVLFLCVANSARSQLAEAWARVLAPEGVRVHSAGSHPGTLNPMAVRVMSEVGIDLSGHHSKSVDDVPLERVGVVVTLCSEEVCPTLPGTVERLHWPFEDPAAETGGEEAALEAFRTARDGIEKRVRELFGRPA